MPRPLHVVTDEAAGGRWTSLRTPEREWLWTNPHVQPAQRAGIRPGDAFVDAGGVEECFPTLRGRPDHGDVWSRPWTSLAPGTASVRTETLSLRRRLHTEDGVLVATYDVTGPAGAPVVHAVHALLDLSPAARLLAPAGAPVILLDHPRPGQATRAAWPYSGDISLDKLGPDDGTARCAVVSTDRAHVLDGAHRLSLHWRVLRGHSPVAFVLWRNLGGWPVQAPYRSVGIEPLLGRSTDLNSGTPEQTAHLDETGRLTWQVHLAAMQDCKVDQQDSGGYDFPTARHGPGFEPGPQRRAR